MLAQMLTALIASTTVQAITYGVCERNNYIYGDVDVNTHLSLASTKMLKNGVTVFVSVQGSITVIDGCRVNISILRLVLSLEVMVYWP
jgi:hypothetical protein